MNSEQLANLYRKVGGLTSKQQARLHDLHRDLRKQYGGKINIRFVGMTNGLLDAKLNKAGRLAFFEWAFDREVKSSHDLTIDEMFALVMWAKPKKGDKEGDGWEFSKQCIEDIQILIEVFAEGVGQMPLFKEETVEKIKHDLGF